MNTPSKRSLTLADGIVVPPFFAYLVSEAKAIQVSKRSSRMVILVTGSRDYRAYTIADIVLSAIADEHGVPCIRHGCARGLDTIAGNIARTRGWEVDTFPVSSSEWRVYGKQAGHLRNKRMVDKGADLCLGFPVGVSRGTMNCMTQAFKKGIPTYQVNTPLPDPSDPEVKPHIVPFELKESDEPNA